MGLNSQASLTLTQLRMWKALVLTQRRMVGIGILAQLG